MGRFGQASLLAFLAALLLVTAPVGHAASGEWGTTRTNAAVQLPERFRNIASVTCAPDRASSTAVIGSARIWHRLVCQGSTFDGVRYRLLFEVRGECSRCWTITNLRGTSPNHLRVKRVAPKPQPPTTTSRSRSCPDGWYRNVYGNCRPGPTADPNVLPGGPSAVCRDGTYSYSQSRSGTCSHHGGVARWL